MMGDRKPAGGHGADPVSVSGRSEPRPTLKGVVHKVRVAPEVAFSGVRTIAVIRVTCDGCRDWTRTLDQSYLVEDLVRVEAMHEGSAP